MAIFIGLLPYLVFCIAVRLLGIPAALCAAALTALALCALDWTGPRRHCGVLELVFLLVFGGLAVYGGLAQVDWTIMGVRLSVDAVLLLVMLASLLIGRPFTLGYARLECDPALWLTPRFIRGHYVVSGVWTAAVAAIVGADALVLVWPNALMVGVAVIVTALLAASRFTRRYAASLRT